jgi:MoaD family protein
MRVEFYGVYRTLAGGKILEVESSPNLTVRDILLNVCARFPALKDELLDQRGDIYPYVPVYVNGRNPRLLDLGMDTPLRAEDVLSLFSPISSGRLNVEALTERSE